MLVAGSTISAGALSVVHGRTGTPHCQSAGYLLRDDHINSKFTRQARAKPAVQLGKQHGALRGVSRSM